MGHRRSRLAVPDVRPDKQALDLERWFRSPGGAKGVAVYEHAHEAEGYRLQARERARRASERRSRARA